MNVRLEWLNVFADNEETLDQHFEQLGKQFFDLYNILKASQSIRFALSNQQQKQFNSFFAQVQKEYSNLFGLDIVASVLRLVVITFRIAMILTSLRVIDGKKIKLELLAGMEDVFSMMDEMSPKVLADYMMHRMRDCFEQKALNTVKRHQDWMERKVGDQW